MKLIQIVTANMMMTTSDIDIYIYTLRLCDVNQGNYININFRLPNMITPVFIISRSFSVDLVGLAIIYLQVCGFGNALTKLS